MCERKNERGRPVRRREKCESEIGSELRRVQKGSNRDFRYREQGKESEGVSESDGQRW